MENTAIVLLCFAMHYLYPSSNTQMVDKADIQSVLHTLNKQTGDLKWNLFTPKRTDSEISPTGIHKSKRAAHNRASQSPGGLNVHMTSPSRRDNSYPGKGDYLTGFSGKGQMNMEGQVEVPSTDVPGNEHLVRKSPSDWPFVSHRYQGGRNAKPEFTIYNTVSGKSTIVTPLDRRGERRKEHLPAYDNWRTHFAAPGLFGNDRMYGTRYNLIRNKNSVIGYGTNAGSGTRQGNTVAGNVMTDKLLNKRSETGLGPRTVDVFVAPGLYDVAPINNKRRGPVKLGESTFTVGSFQRNKGAPNPTKTVNRMERPRILNLVPYTNDHLKDSGNRIMNAANTQMEASGSGEVIVEGGIEIPSRFLDLASISHSFWNKETLINRRANEIVKTNKPDIQLSQTLKPGEIVKLPFRGRIPKVSDKIDGLQNRVTNNVNYNPREHRRFQNTRVSGNVKCKVDPVTNRLSCNLKDITLRCKDTTDIPNPCKTYDSMVNHYRYRHPRDPSKYISCTENGKYYIVQCPIYEEFSVECRQCVEERLRNSGFCRDGTKGATRLSHDGII